MQIIILKTMKLKTIPSQTVLFNGKRRVYRNKEQMNHNSEENK